MAYLIGIDIGGTNIKLGLVNEVADIIEFREYPTPTRSYEKLLSSLTDWINEFRKNYKVEGVGVGCAGVIDYRLGKVKFSPNLPYLNDASLRNDLENKVGLPVFIDNDANVVCWGEYKMGAGIGQRNLICLTLGTGIGGALVFDGKLYRGSWGGGAELGHIALNFEGPICECGNRGCLESFVGASAIIKRAKHLFCLNGRTDIDDITPVKIGRLVSNGDELGHRVIRETAYYLGIGITSLVNVFNPDAVIITGGVSGWGEWLLEPLKEIVMSKSMPYLANELSIVCGTLGNKAGIIGATLLLRKTRLD